MKSYTDIKQSKNLSKMLTIESADMWYDNDGESTAGRPEIRCGTFTGHDSKNIPCWSLAALIEILPIKIKIGESFWHLSIEKRRISYLGHMTYDGQLHKSVESDNLVDACVEMIIRLHELNLL